MKNKRWILYLVLILTLGFIWGNSCFSQADSSEQSSGVLELLRKVFTFFGGESSALFLFIEKYIRKIAHFSEYFLLGGETVFLFSPGGFRLSLQRFWNALSFSVVTAVIDESIQILSGRGPAVLDVLIDSSGALCGILMVGLIFFFVTRKKEKPVLKI